MTLKVDTEFKSICREILSHTKTEANWALIESCDRFQTINYCGGFDTLKTNSVLAILTMI